MRLCQPLQVGQWLIGQNYLLTALELLVEAQEAGREVEVDVLRHFFADQSRFPAEEVARHDPRDGRSC